MQKGQELSSAPAEKKLYQPSVVSRLGYLLKYTLYHRASWLVVTFKYPGEQEHATGIRVVLQSKGKIQWDECHREDKKRKKTERKEVRNVGQT